jgi:hypothetical protein
MAGMDHAGGLAVHEPVSPDHAAAKSLTDSLMSEANTQDRHNTGSSSHERYGDSCFCWSARAGRDDDSGRIEG